MARQSLIPRTLLSFPLARFPSFWEEGDEDLNQLLQQSVEPSGLTLSEDKNMIYVEASLPGLKTDDIEITLEKGVLWIKGDKKEEEEDREKKFYRKATSSFSYRLSLPGQIDENKEPQTSYKDGVLKISFTKAQQSQTKKIKIK